MLGAVEARPLFNLLLPLPLPLPLPLAAYAQNCASVSILVVREPHMTTNPPGERSQRRKALAKKLVRRMVGPNPPCREIKICIVCLLPGFSVSVSEDILSIQFLLKVVWSPADCGSGIVSTCLKSLSRSKSERRRIPRIGWQLANDDRRSSEGKGRGMEIALADDPRSRSKGQA